MLIKAPKGTYDVLPQDSSAWQAVERVMRENAALAGYREIRTPVFEHTELFARGVGDTTDVVQKEMYTFLDKGRRSITLKPEGTAGVVRAMLEAGLHQGALPVKVYYLNTPVFRYEAPQAGRMREHHQFGVEVFGAALPTVDAEVIALAARVIRSLGVDDFVVNINSIGCPVCRPTYHTRLRGYLEERKDGLCETCRERLSRNPMRALDCKVESCQTLLAGAPVPLDDLCGECGAHFDGLKNALDVLGIEYRVNPRIVRGLDYYTRTVFELIAQTDQGRHAVCGGGRYDGLVGQLGGPNMPGIGFGMGIERLLMLLEHSGNTPPSAQTPDVYIAPLSERDRMEAFAIAEQLRGEGIKSDCDHVGRSLKAQFRYADKAGARLLIIIGGDEAARGEARVRDLAAHEEAVIPLASIAHEARERLGNLRVRGAATSRSGASGAEPPSK
ncbi:MAG: histidine--tRNA ligase [Oscillospiraceae bacterium]|jgi:histidyl-tRNA synthetase|nr:histidine--tRNA ligase [Oscillospiraceae bacterium]